MSTTYTVGVRLDGNASSYLRAVRTSESATRGFGRLVQAEFSRLRQFMQSAQGQLAGLGLGVGLMQAQRNAAMLEKTMTQVRLTAGMSVKEQTEGYRRMFELVRRNGGVMEETVGGFNNLIQAGLKYQEAMRATEAISAAKAVTGANDQSLSSGLTVGAANFGFDLAQMGVATRMLDQMTVAGRLGNAELENLSDIFSRVAQRAQSAGMGFETTLAFIEGLSQIERQPERLATLADSTLRLFTNANYAKEAEKATGVKFFAKDGSRRDSLAVLDQLRGKFKELTTDAQRFQFVNKAFGKTDMDTQRGLGALLGSNGLQDIREFERLIKEAGGTVARDLPAAIANAADQSSRLKNTLREAAEDFARPINDAVSNAIRHLLDRKDQGGMGLSGMQVAAGGAAGLVGAYALTRVLPPLMRNLAGRFGGVGAGVATGKALEAAAGVTPVYVTNWSEVGGGGLGGAAGAASGALAGAAGGGLLSKLKTVAAMAAGAPVGALPLAYAAGGVALAGAAGYGAGSLAYKGIENTGFGDQLGGAIAKVLAVFGNENAQRAVAVREALEQTKVGGEITVRVQGNPNLAVQAEVRPFNNTRMRSDVGHTNGAAGY